MSFLKRHTRKGAPRASASKPRSGFFAMLERRRDKARAAAEMRDMYAWCYAVAIPYSGSFCGGRFAI